MKLPPKTKKVVAQLKQAEPEFGWDVLIGAVTGAHDVHKLIPWLIGARAMDRRGYPIIDAIKMAEQLGVAVNLNWSPRRWREEHDQFSRRITLNQMSAENVAYDLRDWKRQLPGNFGGHLITCSKELAQTGFIQQHCVASYHLDVMEGHKCFATVECDGMIWTVLLLKNPLRIAEVRTTRNQAPNEEQEESIQKMLGLTPWGQSTDMLCYDDDLESIESITISAQNQHDWQLRYSLREAIDDVNLLLVLNGLQRAGVRRAVFEKRMDFTSFKPFKEPDPMLVSVPDESLWADGDYDHPCRQWEFHRAGNVFKIQSRTCSLKEVLPRVMDSTRRKKSARIRHHLYENHHQKLVFKTAPTGDPEIELMHQKHPVQTTQPQYHREAIEKNQVILMMNCMFSRRTVSVQRKNRQNRLTGGAG